MAMTTFPSDRRSDDHWPKLVASVMVRRPAGNSRVKGWLAEEEDGAEGAELPMRIAQGSEFK